jgi:CDP-glucose 4,6-dehydratase
VSVPRPALVTGATGLLGQWLVRALVDRGTPVVCLVYEPDRTGDWTRIRLPEAALAVSGDVRDGALTESLLREHDIGDVYHLAAQAIVGVAADDPATTFDVNIRGTWELVDACRRIPSVRAVVVASSDKAYGDADGRPYTEDDPLLASNPYDASKAGADMVARSYAHSYGMPLAVTRCGNLYGGGDLNWSRLVPGTIRSVIADERPIIRSDGTFVRDYLYVKDAAAGYLRVAEGLGRDEIAPGTAFNLATGDGIEALRLAERIVELMGSDLACDVRDEATGEIREQRLDAGRARAQLGWAPSTMLDDALVQTISWYREFLSQSTAAGRPR